MLERPLAASALVLAEAASGAEAARMPALAAEVPTGATLSTPPWQPWSDQIFAQPRGRGCWRWCRDWTEEAVNDAVLDAWHCFPVRRRPLE